MKRNKLKVLILGFILISIVSVITACGEKDTEGLCRTSGHRS
jgi:hypothetical protein